MRIADFHFPLFKESVLQVNEKGEMTLAGTNRVDLSPRAREHEVKWGASALCPRNQWQMPAVARAIVAFALMFCATQSASAGMQTGRVTNFHVRSDGLVYLFLSGSAIGQPICATNKYWIIRDPQSNAGKQQMAVLLSAKASRATVTIVGANQCTAWVDGEDIHEVIMVDG